MAVDLFLYVPGIPGESTAAGFAGQIDVYDYSFGVAAPAPPPGSTSGPGKAALTTLNVTKVYDRSSLPLFRALTTGATLAPSTGSTSVILSIATVPSGGSPVVTLTYAFQDVFVTSIADAAGGGDVVRQQISFTVGIVKETYRQQNPDGSLGPPITVYYNQETNRTS